VKQLYAFPGVDDARVEFMTQTFYHGFFGRNDGIKPKDPKLVAATPPPIDDPKSVTLKLKKRTVDPVDKPEWLSEYNAIGCISTVPSLFFSDKPYHVVHLALSNLVEPMYAFSAQMPQVGSITVKLTVPERTLVWRRWARMKILPMTTNMFEIRRQEDSSRSITSLKSSWQTVSSEVDGFDKRIITLEWKDIPIFSLSQSAYIEVPVRFPFNTSIALPKWQKLLLAQPADEISGLGKAVLAGGAVVGLIVSGSLCYWLWGKLQDYFTPPPHGVLCRCTYCAIQRSSSQKK